MATTDRTGVANRAAALSDMFAVVCARVVVGGDVQRRPVLSLPEGMSTMGGAQARQVILLEPNSGPALTAGWVDLPRKRAGLRTHACILESHRARFKERLFAVDRADYEHFALVARRFLMEQDFVIETEGYAPAAGLGGSHSLRSGSGVLVLLGVMLAAAAIAALRFVMLR